MKRSRLWNSALCLVAVALPGVASAGGMSVSVSADRGANAVYQPGERIQITARCTDDANLLVYDIDAEGKISVLFPYHGENGYVEGHQNLAIPTGNDQDELVVQGPVGQGYIVAIASRSPFRDLPWYLRPYNAQAEGVGYVGAPDSTEDNEQGITPQGTIVGDPFVAMERIRRRVLSNPDDQDAFATAYVSYYVHQQVNYPRYVCADCHRPGYWAWWDGFDPYYATCSAVSFHINFGWYWGWPYWGGYVPYYVYVVRPACPPYYRPWIGGCYSSWDGWARWNTMWGAHIVRYKPPAPPATYVSPAQWRWTAGWQNRTPPPGFMVTAAARGASRMPATPVANDPVVARTDWRPGGELRAPIGRAPASEVPPVPGSQGVTVGAATRAYGREPAGVVQGRGSAPAPAAPQAPMTAGDAARRAVDRAPSQNNVQSYSRQNQPNPQPADPARTPVPGPARYYQHQGPSLDQPRYYQRPSPPAYSQPRYQRPGPSGYPQRTFQRQASQHYGPPGGGRSGGGSRGQRSGGGNRGGRS